MSAGLVTAYPTCWLRQRPTNGPRDGSSLEISHACRLRAKLANPTHKLIVNVWGVGYRLLDEPEP